MTQNDYGLRLYNGDTGVIVAHEGGRKSAVFSVPGAARGHSALFLQLADHPLGVGHPLPSASIPAGVFQRAHAANARRCACVVAAGRLRAASSAAVG